MTKKQKEVLINKYMTNVSELTDYQRNWILKETAHHITVTRDDDGNHICHCDRCGNDFMVAKTKHKDKIKCPSCGHELEILHMWRKFRETLDWIAIPRVIDGHTFMLRYVYVYRHGDKIDIKECARGVFNLNTDSFHPFEINSRGEWQYTRRSYFTEYNMYNFRSWCCLPADLYKPAMIRELKKLDGMKYFAEFLSQFTKSNLYAHTMIGVLSDRCDIYEKLCKAGLTELAKDDFRIYGGYYERRECISNPLKETAILDILRINRSQLKLLRKNQTIKAYRYIQQIKTIDQKLLDLLMESNVSKQELTSIKGRYNLQKTLKYIIKSGIKPSEWLDYVDALTALNYRLDEHYLYPKNFRDADRRVTYEYRIYKNKHQSELQKKMDEKRTVLMRKISEGLRKNTELMKFFEGCDGLQIIVPESPQEMRNHGEYMDNCVGRCYVDKFANGESLIFFIRRIDKPEETYDMEYRDGQVRQLYGKHNSKVEDQKVIDFADALAKSLIKQNILAA